MMNIQELATVMHHKLPIKIFVLNNGGYLTIKQTQQLGFEGRLMGVDRESGLSFPNLRDIGKAHGIAGGTCQTHDRLQEHLKRALDYDGTSYPYICEIMMSPDQPQAPRSVNRRNPDGSMNPTKLEDSFPYLSPETVAEEMKCEL